MNIIWTLDPVHSSEIFEELKVSRRLVYVLCSCNRILLVEQSFAFSRQTKNIWHIFQINQPNPDVEKAVAIKSDLEETVESDEDSPGKFTKFYAKT